jgi:hypothetical protein
MGRGAQASLATPTLAHSEDSIVLVVRGGVQVESS